MQTAEESDRLKALEEYRILDTEPEKLFDDITLLASQICNTPISLISLVDEHRQWFKSKVGLELQETSREVSVCAHAIQEPGHTFIVPNLTKDQRFDQNPLVTAPNGLRFYAGTPLVDSNGYALGTLCVIDKEPRVLTPEQQFALETLAKTVVSLMESRKRNLLFNYFYDQLYVIVNFGCPYFLFLDEKGKIRRFGSNYQFCLKGLSEGTEFDSLFEWEGALNTSRIFEDRERKSSNLVFFRVRNNTLRFRGAFHLFDDFILILCAPVINSRSTINDYGITLKDIPKHDYLSEYLFLQQTTNRSLQDAQSLTERIKSKNTELEKTREELEVALQKETELNQIKSRFISMTSHEFRTPLTTIQSNAELLEMHLQSNGNLEGKPSARYLTRITNEVNRLTGLMNDILLMGRIEAGRVSFNPVLSDLIVLVQDMLETTRFDELENRRTELHVEGLPRPVRVDAFLFHHILSNLVSNAIKYSRGKPAPRITLIYGAGETSVAVTDYGIGIPATEVDNVFESFFRASNVENIQGTGLGLAIVKQFVEMHDGQISMTSEVGFGSTVTVTFPG